MTPETFLSQFQQIKQTLLGLVSAVDSDNSLVGVLSIEDYVLFTNFVKEYSWYSFGG